MSNKNPQLHPENLKPFNTLDSAKRREISAKGGKKKAENTRQRRLLSEVYADFLADKHDVIGRDGLKKQLTGNELLIGVMSKVLARGDSAAVSLMREMREAIEGQSLLFGGMEDAPPVKINIIGVSPEENDNE